MLNLTQKITILHFTKFLIRNKKGFVLILVFLLFYFTGELFAACPIDKYPGGLSVEPVTDSSRYFVLKIVNENGESKILL